MLLAVFQRMSFLRCISLVRIINPSIVQLLITIGGVVVTVMLIRYAVIALHGHSVVKNFSAYLCCLRVYS